MKLLKRFSLFFTLGVLFLSTAGLSQTHEAQDPPAEESIAAPSPRSLKPAMSLDELKKLYGELKRNPLFRMSDPQGLCHQRAFLLNHELDTKLGISSQMLKIQCRSNGIISVVDPYNQRYFEYVWHFATLVKVRSKEGVDQDYILDPQFSAEPLPLEAYLKATVDPLSSLKQLREGDEDPALSLSAEPIAKPTCSFTIRDRRFDGDDQHKQDASGRFFILPFVGDSSGAWNEQEVTKARLTIEEFEKNLNSRDVPAVVMSPVAQQKARIQAQVAKIEGTLAQAKDFEALFGTREQFESWKKNQKDALATLRNTP